MELETVNRSEVITQAKRPYASPRRERIISESTGLVKFNITKKKFEELDTATENFQKLEAEVNGQKFQQRLAKKHSVNHLASPVKAIPVSELPQSQRETERGLGMFDEDILLELASKQREVLELKSKMETLKQRLVVAEREMHEIEMKCNRSPSASPQRSNTDKLRYKPTAQILKSTLLTQSSAKNNNFVSLKKKMSLSQMKLADNSPFNQSLNNNLQKFQKESNLMLERGKMFMNNLRSDMFNEKDDRSSEDDYDFGEADASDYMMAVK